MLLLPQILIVIWAKKDEDRWRLTYAGYKAPPRCHISKRMEPCPTHAVQIRKLRASASHPVLLVAPVQAPYHVPCHASAVSVLLPEVLGPHETIGWCFRG